MAVSAAGEAASEVMLSNEHRAWLNSPSCERQVSEETSP